ncbi:hypothetical protein GCM10018785_32570 [Streptomyces longispororuber]|uniref:Uncharacterized protein n=1 Tax=Streptomyces longispororuber TaxID=68230 RepID=A0A919DLP9_9ACTN|nr:hypothetical protein [Streptomyces longispororuber]GHE60964.1 hypothetical protein GCM10018785_32570 [Streptomyces longispororuber]
MSADQPSHQSAVYEAHFTWTPVQLLSGAATKRLVAFRVDAHGVTLGGAPAKYAKQTAVVPWQDIEAVVLWQHNVVGGTPMAYVGLRRRPGAPPLPGQNARLSPEETARLAPHVDHDVFLASRSVNLWTLDRERLTAAVRAFAPGVPVQDIPNA